MKALLAGMMVFGLATASAEAATLKLVISGVVSDQQDVGNVVWGGQANIGAAFTATYLIDTAGWQTTYTDPGTGEVDKYLYGGAAYAASSIASAILTIGSISKSISGAAASAVTLVGAGNTAPDNIFGATGFMRYESHDDVSDATSGTSADISFDIADILGNSFNIPADFDVPYNLTSADVRINGIAEFQSYYGVEYINGHWFHADNYYSYTNFIGTSAVLTRVSDVAPVPLPASSGLLLAGVTTLGAVTRRKRRATV